MKEIYVYVYFSSETEKFMKAVMKGHRPEWLIVMHLNNKPCSILQQSRQNQNQFPF